MPDTKISALTAATTPLAGTEVLPIVQSSTTKKVSIADVTAGRAISTAGVTDTSLTASKPVFTDASKKLTSSGTLATDQGGTGLTSYSQGDLVYYNTGTTLTALPKNTNATRYLANTGTSNNPAWAQVDLTNGVTGTLPVGNGGTGLASYTADRILYASGTTTIATSAGLTFDGTNFATTGTASATKFIPTGGTATGNGMYLPAANTLGFTTNSAERARITSDGKFLSNGLTNQGYIASQKAITVNTGTSITLDCGFGAHLYISVGDGSSAVYWCPYSTTTTLLNSAGISWAATNAGSSVRVYKSTNTVDVTLSNQTGTNYTFYILAVTGY